MKCRICNTDTVSYLDLGMQPASDAFLTKEQLEVAGEKVYPLILTYCPSCSLSQLSHVVPADELYNNEYPYETGVNSGGVKHFREMAWSIDAEFSPDYVVDVGSNDGTLLAGFDCKVCGIEPVGKIAEKAKVHTVNRFFDIGSVTEVLAYGGEPDVVTATNVFAHVDDLHGFMEALDHLLAYNGVFVIEAPYFVDMIRDLAFDTVYHEHLSYLSIKPLTHLFRTYGMEIFDVRHFPIHCGTMRYYVARRGVYKIRNSVDLYFEAELEYHNIERLKEFGIEVWNFLGRFIAVLLTLNSRGPVVGVSAPAKGNTLLNSNNMSKMHLLEYITEKSEHKIGKYTPGTHIEVVPDSRLIEDQPDYAIIFAHNWSEQIKNNLKDYKGEWIIPTPKGIEEYEERQQDLHIRIYGVSRQRDSQRVAAQGV